MAKYNYPLAKPYIGKDDIHGVVSVLKSGMLSLGPKCKIFESDFAKKIGTKYACSVSSGTAGLHLAIKSLDIHEGDEVITSPFSFVASCNCILFEKATPVFIDIKEDTFNMDPDLIEKNITKRTKAILVVHIFGQAADMKKIMGIAKKYKLKVIEDACESLGSNYLNKPVGSFGDVGVFAFYPNKQMTTGEGGMIVTNSKAIEKECSILRNQGRDENDAWLEHGKLGYNYRLDEMSASLGITQLKKLDFFISQRRKIASWYATYLSQIDNVILPKVAKDRTHSWFVYVIRVKSDMRNKLLKQLDLHGIKTKPYLPSIHLQSYMKKEFGYRKGMFPVSELVSSETLALPFYVGLTKADVKKISNEIKEYL